MKKKDFLCRVTKLTNEITNQLNESLRKDKDHQNSLEHIYNDIIYCTECLSNDLSKPFIIEPTTLSRDDSEIYSSKLKVNRMLK